MARCKGIMLVNSLSSNVDVFKLVKSIPAHEVAQRFGLDLQKKGGRWMARCPFHEDKTPSFFLYRERFHCFGCSWGGDAVDLVAELGNIRPHEAARDIARAFGLDAGRVNSRGTLLKLQRERREAAEQEAREKAERERIISRFQLVHRAALKTIGQIKTEADLDRYGWIYRYITRLELIALALIAKDPETRSRALTEAGRWTQ